MILQRGWAAFEQYFFKPISPAPLGAFRVLYGLCVMSTLLLLHGDWLDWLGTQAWVTRAAMTQIEPGSRLNVFAWMPQDDRWISALFWVALVAAAMLTLGLWSRVSSVAVFLCVASIQQRNLLILHGGDTFLRVAGFFLMFAPAGAAFSVDRWIRRKRGLEGPTLTPQSPWAQRMIQFELAVLYFTSFLWKLKGHAWLDGSALAIVVHLRGLQRFPVAPWLEAGWILKLGSWLTLLFEGAWGFLVWVRRFRYWVLGAGVLFHLTLEYTLNIPMFQWDVLAAYVLFLVPEDARQKPPC